MSSYTAKIKIEARPLFKELWTKINTKTFGLMSNDIIFYFILSR